MKQVRATILGALSLIGFVSGMDKELHTYVKMDVITHLFSNHSTKWADGYQCMDG